MIRAASLHRSPESTKEDQRLRLLAGLTHVVHVQKADVERAAGLQEANWREFVGGQRAAGLKVSQAHRLTASLMRNYSVTQCIGPTSTRALESRRNHPNPNVEEDFLLAGQESDFGGGHRQRVCRIKNACLRAYDTAVHTHRQTDRHTHTHTHTHTQVHLHMDPYNEISSQFLKVEGQEGLGTNSPKK